MSRYDVVVVGGRVAGASTALLLACSGVRVILIDRDRYGSDTLSTHGLMRAGVLQLHRWGVLPDVLAAGTPPIREVIFSYSDGERTSIAIRPSAGVGALFAPRRYLLDRLLVDAAAAAGVEIRHETSVTALLRDSVERVVVCGFAVVLAVQRVFKLTLRSARTGYALPSLIKLMRRWSGEA